MSGTRVANPSDAGTRGRWRSRTVLLAAVVAVVSAAGAAPAARYGDVDFDMVVAPDRSADEVIADYRTAITDSDAHIRAAGGLDVRTAHPVGDEPLTLRWVLAHMTSETVRHAGHAGHADILRELIDGTTGR